MSSSRQPIPGGLEAIPGQNNKVLVLVLSLEHWQGRSQEFAKERGDKKGGLGTEVPIISYNISYHI